MLALPGYLTVRWATARLSAGEIVYLKGGDLHLADETVRVDTFALERYEVSNEQYWHCVQIWACPPLAVEEYKLAGKASLPVVNITASQAIAYCAWLGRRLPSAAEWIWAIRGPEGRDYPWGNKPPPTSDYLNLVFDTTTKDWIGRAAARPVTDYPLGKTPGTGVYNLAGNALEWTATPVGAEYSLRDRWDGTIANQPDQLFYAGTGFHHVVALARQHHVTRGRKLRLDSTVVETNVHYPVDSTLLADGVRVLARTIRRAKPILQDRVARARTLFRDRTRSVRQVTKELIDAARRRGEQAAQEVKERYERLLDLTREVVQQAQQVQQHLQSRVEQEAECLAKRLAETIETFVPRVEQVITQTTRRVLHDEQVPASEKLVSLFEPHTAIIRKGKAGKPVAFGRVLWLGEAEGGIITQATILDGNPDDAAQFLPSLETHAQQFGRPPNLIAGDGKLATPTNEQAAQQRGVKHIVLPRPGRKTQARQEYERQRWFRKGRDWRAGIEGRISGLKRRHGLRRCRYHGDEGMARWVGWGVLAHDLRVIAQHEAARAAPRDR